MVDRPFKNVRPIGPLIYINSESQSASTVDGVEFESMSDLPDSPMLRQYVKKQIDYTGLDEKTVINSSPVREYMKRLGVWNMAVDMNR